MTGNYPSLNRHCRRRMSGSRASARPERLADMGEGEMEARVGTVAQDRLVPNARRWGRTIARGGAL